MLRLLRPIAAAALLVCFSSLAAIAADWQVEKTTAGVNFTVDKRTWFPVQAGLMVPNSAWISTGPRGRLTLSRGVERMSFAPRTLAAVITRKGLLSRKTEVVQQKGEIALDIEKRGRPHTYVHTPFLAAVVKGTSFTVSVTERDASVSVERGLVQVSSFTGGQSTDVGPGQQATVDQTQTMTVAGTTAAPSVFSAEPTQSAVRAVGQQAPIGAGMGLSGFTGQGNDRGDATGSASQNSVDGESSEGAHDNSGNGGGAAPGNGNPGQGHGNSAGAGNGHAGNSQGNDKGHAQGGGGAGNGNAGNSQGNTGGNGNAGSGDDGGGNPGNGAGGGGDDDDDDDGGDGGDDDDGDDGDDDDDDDD